MNAFILTKEQKAIIGSMISICELNPVFKRQVKNHVTKTQDILAGEDVFLALFQSLQMTFKQDCINVAVKDSSAR